MTSGPCAATLYPEEMMQAEYERRLAAAQGTFGRQTGLSSRLTLAVLVAVALSVLAGYRVLWVGNLPLGWLFAPLLVAAALTPLMLRARSGRERAMRLVQLYERSLRRVRGEGVQSGHTGEEFREDSHLYDRDLGVLGEDSLFGMLATTRTAVGQKALAGLLLHGVTGEEAEARARQQAVQELAPMPELRERVALLGRSDYEEVPAERFAEWLALPDTGLERWMRWALASFTFGWLGLVLAACFLHGMRETLLQDAFGVLALQGAFALWLKPRVVPELEAAQRLAGQTMILRDGLGILRGEPFTAPLLVRLQREAEGEESALRRLWLDLELVEQRSKEFNYAFGLLLAVGSQSAVAMATWRRQHGDSMRRWVAAWAELEALLAVATYAAEHEENTWPEIVDGEAVLAAEAVTHPLLPRAVAVANDVRLGGETRFLLISGSNMAGKSTLLRAMGTNVVLALAGAPVCARSMRLSSLQVGASLALVDSLAEGKSKFLAEVERLRDLVRLSHSGSTLFLVDEIFSGTNSADRGVAAEAVVRALVQAGAIGALSTHDLALTEFAASLGGTNVHMASPDESDPLGFDYVLKPGVNRTTNALAIVKMLGL